MSCLELLQRDPVKAKSKADWIWAVARDLGTTYDTAKELIEAVMRSRPFTAGTNDDRLDAQRWRDWIGIYAAQQTDQGMILPAISVDRFTAAIDVTAKRRSARGQP